MITTVAGIPCTIDYTVSGNYCHAITNRDPDSCHEEELPEIEFTVCDRRGRPAPWLEKKLTPADITRIENEILGVA